MRVLLSSTWGYGHVFPMVPLAQACLAAGHDVLWVASEAAGPLIEAIADREPDSTCHGSRGWVVSAAEPLVEQPEADADAGRNGRVGAVR